MGIADNSPVSINYVMYSLDGDVKLVHYRSTPIHFYLLGFAAVPRKEYCVLLVLIRDREVGALFLCWIFFDRVEEALSTGITHLGVVAFHSCLTPSSLRQVIESGWCV